MAEHTTIKALRKQLNFLFTQMEHGKRYFGHIKIHFTGNATPSVERDLKEEKVIKDTIDLTKGEGE